MDENIYIYTEHAVEKTKETGNEQSIPLELSYGTCKT